MTMFLFEKWASEIFFPTIEWKRAQYHYKGQSLLIIDGFGAHNTDHFAEECEKRKITVKFLIAHTSDRCQPLDFVTFANLKRHYASIRCDTYTSAQCNKIVRMMRAWSAATSPDLIVTSFVCAGIVPYINPSNRIIYCRIDLSASLKLKHLVPSLSSIVPPSPPKKRIKIDRQPPEPH
jgi:hypothetical protein